ncbi:MAG TPA: M23 family metallopeptidase [Puia sp.]|nr:M23 family metallopeptidase [Puia sp.]
MISLFPGYKKLVIPLFLLLVHFSSSAQRVIEVKYQQDQKGAYVFSCVNYAFCNYILEIGFTSFTNVKCDQPLPFHAEVKPGYNKLFSISAVDPQAAVQFKYQSTFQKGCIHPDVNRDIIYLLPITPGTQAQVYEMSPVKSSDSGSWYVLRLKMKSGDTIYAARKGIVNDMQDQNGANDAGQVSIGKENFIEITQPDCSFARYGILRKNSALVKPGQLVKAGQPIGLVGGDAYGRGSDLRFSVYYYQEDNGTLNETAISHYIVPQIWTKNNGKGRLKHGAIYISEFPAPVLNQEIPKKAQSAKRKA